MHTSPFILRAALLLLLLPCACIVAAQELSIIPQPVSMQVQQGTFEITSTTSITAPAAKSGTPDAAKYLSDRIKRVTGWDLAVSEKAGGAIQLVLMTKPDTRLGNEGYLLDVNSNRALVQANAPAGLFYGVQTLLQLLPKEIESATVAKSTWKIPAVAITDYPRFAWRGLMLDVSRHFYDKEYVKKYIDRMSEYKFNRLHWHLTDDNGWRLEIKSLPRLTEVGAWRVPRTGTFGNNEPPKPGEKPTYGGFYTQDDVREIVQYAKARNIEVLPEIESPGHSMAALAAYPELCVTGDTSLRVNPGSSFSTWFGNGKFEMHLDNTFNPTDERVYQFLDKVFTEVAALFPFEYIHMGGDECYKGFWERDAKVQAFMKKNKIANGEALQSYFTGRVQKIIQGKKKKLMGWDEILEGGELAPGAAVMAWRGTKGGVEASHKKHTVVMSPAPIYYLDMRQGDPSIEPPIYSDARLKDVYAFDILVPGIDSTYVIGGQGNLWTEQMPTPAQAEYMTFPRAFAIAEGLWTPRAKKNWSSFATRAEQHFDRLDEAGANYARSMYDPIIKVTKDDAGRLTINLATEVSGLDIYYTVDNSLPNAYHPKYTAPIAFPDGADNFRLITYRNGKPIGHLISLKTEELEKRVKK